MKHLTDDEFKEVLVLGFLLCFFAPFMSAPFAIAVGAVTNDVTTTVVALFVPCWVVAYYEKLSGEGMRTTLIFWLVGIVMLAGSFLMESTPLWD